MILLDTHIWLRWLIDDVDPLPEKLVSIIENADEIGVSVLSCWEVVYLSKRKRIHLSIPLRDWMEASLHGSGVQCLPLTCEVALKAALLPEIHRDPVDRFLIAEAIVQNIQLISLDSRFKEYTELKDLLVS